MKNKKLFGILLALSLLINSIWLPSIFVSATDISDGNIVANGDFEQELTGWQDTKDECCGISENGYGGTGKAFMLSANGSEGQSNKGITQNITLRPNSDYQLSVWVSFGGPDSDWQAWSHIEIKAGGRKIIDPSIQVKKENGWEKKVFAFKTGADVSGAAVSVLTAWKDDAVTLFDDLKIEPKPSFDGFITNGDFETGNISGWKAEGGLNVSLVAPGSEGTDDSVAVKLAGNEGAVFSQLLKTEPVGKYILSFKLKNGGASESSEYKVKIADSKTELASKVFSPDSAGEWQEYALEFCGNGEAEVKVSFVAVSSEPILLDCISISEVQGIYSGQIFNGGFETGTLKGWEKPADGVCEVIKGGANGTDYALKMNTSARQWNGPRQQVTVKPNTIYDFSVWVKIPDNSERSDQWHVIALKDTNGNDKFNISLHIRSKEWQQVTAEITTDAETDTLTVAPMIANIYQNSSFIIDQLSFAERDASYDGFIRNGDFEINKTEHWSVEGNAEVKVIFDENNRALRLTGDAESGLYQDIIVEKDKKYTFSVNVKAASDSENKGVTAFVKDDAGNIIGSVPIENLKADEYTTFSFDIKSGDNTGLTVGIDTAGGCDIIADNFVFSNYKPIPLTLSEFRYKYNTVANQSYNLLSDPGFEENGGIWSNNGFLKQGVLSITANESHSGKKSLHFNTAGKSDTVKQILWLDVEPGTEYVFSAWVKGPFLSEENIGKATFGIVDPETNGYLVDPTQPVVLSNAERQMCPTAYDNEWHIIAVAFNSGEKERIGIAVSGCGSQLYLDDVVFCRAIYAEQYEPEGIKNIVKIEDTADFTRCSEKHNLLENYDFSDLKSLYWANAQGYKNSFLKIAENSYEYGNSLEYSQSEVHSGIFCIKWVDIKPNTSYTFSGNIKTLEEGDGFLCLLDSKNGTSDYIQKTIFENEGNWESFAVTFNSGKITCVGVAVCDLGGKALIDNIRLFETANGANVTDKFIPVPDSQSTQADEPQETQENNADTYKNTKEESKKQTLIKRTKRYKKANGDSQQGISLWLIAVITAAGAAAAAGTAAVTIVVKKRRSKTQTAKSDNKI